MVRSALERHREALLERAVRLQTEREERRAERKAREQAELNATGRVVRDNGGPIAEMVRELRKGERKGWSKWW
jgi:hypothetical protein